LGRQRDGGELFGIQIVEEIHAGIINVTMRYGGGIGQIY
jgi:hypothetical protein